MTIKVKLRGQQLLRDPLFNKGTAYTDKEKEAFSLFGLVPSHTESLEEQVLRAYEAFTYKDTDLEKHIYLRAVQDRNEVLFYRLILDHLTEMLPIIYTPVVGQACQLFHRIYRQPRGLTLSYPEKNKMEHALRYVAEQNRVKVIVVTDGERILGLGDQGAGGLGIPIGKLSLYTACGGINPANTLPIVLDVGTNNQERLNDPEYLGWRHARITGDDYYDFVDYFVKIVKKHLPHVLLQFEDFAQQHAYPLLMRYRDKLCTFNDDIQGTAAAALAAVVAATKVANVYLKDQRIALFGAGSAGCGISEQLVNVMVHQGLSRKEAYSRFYAVDRNGLLIDDMPNIMPFQKHFAQTRKSVQKWTLEHPNHITLMDVINNAKPTILLGLSAQPNSFTEQMIRQMISYCPRPIIFPLSNPTSRIEATPSDLLTWTLGKALVAAGSPFEHVKLHGRSIRIAQCNNSYIFPGVGLGLVTGKAKHVSDKMMMAAGLALSELAPAMHNPEGALLPPLTTIRDVSKKIAKAVILQGIRDGFIEKMTERQIDTSIDKTMWTPKYEEFSA